MRDYREIMKNIENVYRDNIVKERRKAIRRRRIGLGASIVLAVTVIALLIFSRQNRVKNNYEPGGIYIASADADMAFVAQLHITSAKLSGGCVSAQISWDGKTRFEPDACEWYLTDKSGHHYDIRLSDTASAEQLVFDVSEAVDEEAQVTLICKKDNIIYRKRVMRHGEGEPEEPKTEADPEVETETVYIIDDGNGDVTYLPDRRPGWENGLPMLKETDDRWHGRDPGPLLNKIDMYLYEEMVQGKDSYIAELSVADREAFLSGSGAGLKYLTDVADPRKALVAEMTEDQIFDLCEDDAVYSLSFYNARLSLGTLVVVPVYISREEFYESYEYFTGMKYEEYESWVDHYRSLQEEDNQ